MHEERLSQLELLKESWRQSFRLISSRPLLILPFGIVALLELAGVFLLFVAIQPPYLKLIIPPILRFWGPQFLHYPYNLILLSQLFYYLQIAVALIIGTFMTGVTISAVYQFNQKKDFSLLNAFKRTFINYIGLIIITVLVFLAIQYLYSLEKKVLLRIIMKGPGFLGLRREDWVIFSIVFWVFMSGIVQSLFIFAQPIIMIDNKNFITAIFRNLRYVRKNFFAAVVLVTLPLCFYMPVALLKNNLFSLMKRTMPEVSIVLLISGILISLFINVIITISTTKLYLFVKQEKS